MNLTRLKILFLLDRMKIGGVETRLLENLKGLQYHGIESIVASAGGEYVSDLIKKGTKHFKLPIYLNSSQKTVSMINLLQLPLTIITLSKIINREKCTTIHAHSFFPILIGFFLAMTTHRKLFVTIHSPNKNIVMLLRPFLIKSEKIAIVSKETEIYLQQFSIPKKLLIFLPNSIEVPSINPYKLIHRKTKKILLVSRFSKSKLQAIVTSIKSVILLNENQENTIFHIAGDGKYREVVLKEINRANANNVFGEIIFFLGPRTDIIDLIKEYDVIIGVGRVILEAMSLGCPSIIMGNYYGGLMDSENKIERFAYYNFTGRENKFSIEPLNFSTELASILSNESLLQKASEAGYNYVKKNLNVYKRIKVIIKAYVNDFDS